MSPTQKDHRVRLLKIYRNLTAIGTRSILFGAHQFAIHPWFVARAWWKLFGFPKDPRLWIAFFIHDLGYWGKPNMDGEEGESHVLFGATIMGIYFGDEWWEFCAFHSRHWAQKWEAPFSRLCVADKLAVVLEPWWFYLPRGILSGEVKEYRAIAEAGEDGKYGGEDLEYKTPRAWFASVQKYLTDWVNKHKNGEEDTWTRRRRTKLPQSSNRTG